MSPINPTQSVALLSSALITSLMLFSSAALFSPARIVSSETLSPDPVSVAAAAPVQRISVALMDNGVVVAKKEHVLVRGEPIHLRLEPTDTPASLATTSGVDTNAVTLQVAPLPTASRSGSPVVPHGVKGWVLFADATMNMVLDPAHGGSLAALGKGAHVFTQKPHIQTVRLPWGVSSQERQVMLPLTASASAPAAGSARVLWITLDPVHRPAPPAVVRNGA